jgi:hypothetical protein
MGVLPDSGSPIDGHGQRILSVDARIRVPRAVMQAHEKTPHEAAFFSDIRWVSSSCACDGQAGIHSMRSNGKPT